VWNKISTLVLLKKKKKKKKFYLSSKKEKRKSFRPTKETNPKSKIGKEKGKEYGQ
jgi:hypothetical protein